MAAHSENIDEGLLTSDLASMTLSQRPVQVNKPVSVRNSFICTLRREDREGIRTIPLASDACCRSALVPPRTGFNYFSLGLARELSPRDVIRPEAVSYFGDKIKDQIQEYFKAIENGGNKGLFAVGLEARFGKLYWRLPESASRWQSKKPSDIRGSAKGCNFYPGVENWDALIREKECIESSMMLNINFDVLKDSNKINVKMLVVESPAGTFALEKVYQDKKDDSRIRIEFVVPGRRYDFRISDTTALTVEEKDSAVIRAIAQDIAFSLQRSNGSLSLVLKGTMDGLEWNVTFIRQKQEDLYHWEGTAYWKISLCNAGIYNVPQDVLEQTANNEVFRIPEFPVSRKEVEFWHKKFVPRSEGSQEYHDWGAAELMENFLEFLMQSFRIAEKLDSCA